MMNLKKPIHDLLKVLEWETVDQVPIAGVWPLRENEPDRPFDDQINVAQCYLSHLDDSWMLKGEECRSQYGFLVGSFHWNGICIWVEELPSLGRLRRPWRG